MFRKITQKRFATLVLSEHFEGKLNGSIASCVTAAQKLTDPDIDVLCHGSAASVQSQVDELKTIPGLRKILTATHDDLENPYGQAMAHVAKKAVE